MQIVKRIVKIAMSLTLMVAIALSLPANSLADDCGRSDRVDVPDCVEVQWLPPNYKIYNRCEKPVTLKFDIPGKKDKRQLIDVLWHSDPVLIKTDKWSTVKCCPRYEGDCYQ